LPLDAPSRGSEFFHPLAGYQGASCGPPSGGREAISPAAKEGETGGLWPRRFGEPVIRDERDDERPGDYVHDNPVKPGHVKRVADWPYASFHQYVRRGIYNLDWAAADEVRGMEME
jgi:putative transposase